jgi:hypothetical protein
MIGRGQQTVRKRSGLSFACTLPVAIGLALPSAKALADENQIPDWVKHLEFVDKPALEIEKRPGGSVSGKARIVIKNNGRSPSEKIAIECTVFDQAGNTVDTLTGTIGKIKPGRLGIGEATSYSVTDMARDIECDITPGNVAWRAW